MTETEAWDWGFPKAVKRNVGFLEASGFSLTDEESERVRYESPAGVFVLLFRDRIDHFVGFRVGLVAHPKDTLTEAEVLSLAGQRLPGQFPGSPDEIEDAVAEVARRLREYGEEALSGATSVYEAAHALRKAHTQKYSH